MPALLPTAAADAASRPVLPSLTGLRFVAAMAVVLYHLPMKPFASETATRLVAHGYLGVSLFFVLSGFILTYTYIDADTGALRGSVRDFWWARVARIYPVYLIALLLSLPIFVIFRVLVAAPAARPPAYLSAVLTPLLLQAWWPTTATQWNTPGWSLSVELFFYALFPFAAVWLARRRRATAIAGAIWLLALAIPAAYLVVATGPMSQTPGFDRYLWLQAIKFNPVSHLGEFALGVAAGLSFLRRSSSLPAPLPFGWVAAAGIVLLGLVAATTGWLPYALCHNGLLAPLWASLILGLAANQGLAARVLGSRPLVRLGEASFALYLLHTPLLGYHELARGLLRIRHPGLSSPAWVQAGAILVVAVAVSLYVFRHGEQPGRRIVRDWARRASPPYDARSGRRSWWRARTWSAQES